jgi:hypothetical protein
MRDIDSTFGEIPPSLRTFSQHTDSQQNEMVRKGMFLPADDMEVGMFFTVNSRKDEGEAVQCFGMPLRITAINLPYIAAEIQGSGDVIVLDERVLVFQRITKEFAEAAGRGFMQKLPGT